MKKHFVVLKRVVQDRIDFLHIEVHGNEIDTLNLWCDILSGSRFISLAVTNIDFGFYLEGDDLPRELGQECFGISTDKREPDPSRTSTKAHFAVLAS